MIKKIILWFFLILLILLAVLSYIGYRSFNQEAFKNQIVSSVQELTGRTFSVNGPYALAWDPLPTMTLENVSLSNIENSPNSEMFKADKIQIQIEWASLLRSPTRIKNIIVINPEVLVERISRSVTNINFPHLFAANDTLSTDTILGEPRKQAKIDNIHIENGSLQYINQMSKQDYRLTQLTGEIAIGSLSGPFGFEGKGAFHNVPIKINVSLGAHDVSSPIDFLANLTAPESDSHLKLDGKLFPEDSEKYLSGHASFEIQKPNALLRQLGLPSIPEANDKSSVGTMAFEMGATKETLSDVVFKLGDAENDLASSINYTKTYTTHTSNLNMEINTLNLDEWQNTFKAMLEQKLLSDNSQTEFNINIANVMWNNQAATTLVLNGLLSADQIKLNNSSVLLPGPTTVQMEGLIGTDLSSWTGLAKINLQSQNLKSVLPFVNLDKPFLNDILNKVQKTEFVLATEWDPVKTTFTFPALMLDETTGIAFYETNQNNPTQISLELANINLNSYIQAPKKQFSAEELKGLFLEQMEKLSLPENPMDIELTLNNVTLKDAQFENITSNISTNQNNLKIEAVANTSNQDDLVLMTEVQNVGSADWQIVDGAWQLDSPNLAQLLHILGITSDNKLVQMTRSLNAQGTLAGNKNEWTLAMGAETQVFSLQADGQLINQKPSNLSVRFTHTSIPHLLVELFDQDPMPLLIGTFTGAAMLNQTDDIITMSKASIVADNQHLEGEIAYNTKTNGIQANLYANTLDAAKFLPDAGRFYLSASGFDGNPFQLDLLKKLNGHLNLRADTLTYQTSTFKNATLQAHLENNTLTLDDFIAAGENESSSTIQARGTFAFAQKPTLNLKLVTQQLPITSPIATFDGVGLSGGILTSEWNLISSGETPLQMARMLEGNGTIRLDNSTFLGADLAVTSNIINQAQERDETKQTYEPKLKHALANGATPVRLIEGNFSIKEGAWQMPGASMITEQAKTSSLNVSWDIPSTTIKANAPLQLNAYPALPSIVLNLHKDKRGIVYTANVEAFATALVDEFAHQKEEQRERAIQERKAELEKELADTKHGAEETLVKLSSLLKQVEQQLNETPDTNAQRGFKTAEMMYQTLSGMILKEDLKATQYQYITNQSNKALTDLKLIQTTLFAQNVQNIKKKSSDLLKPTNDLILKLNEMYQKRPTLTLLADLLQNSENQREIMSRALKQFDKDLTYDQIVKVADIIKNAHEKVVKAYGYAEEIYSGRQDVPTSNTIKKVAP